MNYQHYKLPVKEPDLVNLFILSFFFIASLATTRKYPVNSNQLLSIPQTNQLRGLAIFFVVLGHFWVHVSKSRANIVLAGDAVSLFLILSGFGLTVSGKINEQCTFTDFFKKRIIRVFIPYWIATIFILFMDYLFLQQKLPVNSTLLTTLALNLSKETQQIDYVRWFVTFLLLWYFLFFLLFIRFPSKHSTTIMWIFSFIIFPIHYYYLNIGWYHFFSFPLGCTIGIYHGKICTIFKENSKKLFFASSIGLSYVLAYKLTMATGSFGYFISLLPSFGISFIYEINSIIISISTILMIGFFSSLHLSNSFFTFLGKYSYELFLLHGAFLVKYNPIISHTDTLPLLMEFCLFFVLISILSFAFGKAVLFVNNAL